MNEGKPVAAPQAQERFSVTKRAKSFAHAWRGIGIFLKSTPNALIQMCVFFVAVVLGVYFSITHMEWIALVLASGLVLAAEAFNRALEIDIDLTSPDIHPLARDTKDVAAGAVLIAAMVSVVVGIEIFWHYFAALFA